MPTVIQAYHIEEGSHPLDLDSLPLGSWDLVDTVQQVGTIRQVDTIQQVLVGTILQVRTIQQVVGTIQVQEQVQCKGK